MIAMAVALIVTSLLILRFVRSRMLAEERSGKAAALEYSTPADSRSDGLR